MDTGQLSCPYGKDTAFLKLLQDLKGLGQFL